MNDRKQHLQWCKDRADAYLKAGDHAQAWASFCSDMRKHPETANHEALRLGVMLQFSGGMSDVASVRDFIQGFN
jgi:hypothetical protein